LLGEGVEVGGVLVEIKKLKIKIYIFCFWDFCFSDFLFFDFWRGVGWGMSLRHRGMPAGVLEVYEHLGVLPAPKGIFISATSYRFG
jgi:hypothetical protein